MTNVFLVEDEPIVLKILEKLIVDADAGYRIAGKARNGKSALAQLANGLCPDIVLTDINMPELDGLELISEINRLYPEIVIIVLSVYSDYTRVREAFCRGASDYLLKTNLSETYIIDVLDSFSDIGQMRAEGFQSPDMEAHYAKMIAKAQDYIREHIHMPLPLSSVADTVSVSPNYLSYLFHKITGKRYLEYVTYVRIETAKKLIRSNAEAKIYEVAHLTGYSNAEHFSRTFKRVTGTSPYQYKKTAL